MAMTDEERRERARIRAKKYLENLTPEQNAARLEKQRERQKRYLENPEKRKKNNDACRERNKRRYHTDPEFRANKLETSKKYKTSEKTKAKHREYQRKYEQQYRIDHRVMMLADGKTKHIDRDIADVLEFIPVKWRTPAMVEAVRSGGKVKEFLDGIKAVAFPS